MKVGPALLELDLFHFKEELIFMTQQPDLRKQRFLKYVRRLADLYGLKDWSFEIGNDEPNDPSALASIFCTNGRKHAFIRLTQPFLDSKPEEQRQTILHELTHCHTAMMHYTVDLLLNSDKQSTFLMHMEYAVDGIASGIASYFPLPE